MKMTGAKTKSIILMILSYFIVSVPALAKNLNCLQYFSDFTNHDIPLLEKTLLADLETRGRSHADTYLSLNEKTRLKYYDVIPLKLMEDESVQEQLKIEQLYDFGFRTLQEIEVLNNNLGPGSIEVAQRPNEKGLYQVHRWIPLDKVPLDSKTGVIDANNKVGIFLLKQVLNHSAQQKTSQKNSRRTNMDGLLFVDWNHLKLINSTRRLHLAGDEYLITGMGDVKGNLNLNPMEKNHDIGFKVGGDEFVFFIRNTTLLHLKSLSERITESFAGNDQLKELFQDPLRHFTDFSQRLLRLKSYQELSRHPEVLEFLLKTKLWTHQLTRNGRRQAIEKPEYFREFILKYLNSDEVKLRLLQYSVLKPGVSVGYKLIRPGQTFEEIYTAADKDMTRRKNIQREIDFEELPENVTIKPSLFTLPDFSF